MYVIIAPIQIKDGYKDRFIEEMIGDASGSVNDEPGCLRFDVIQDAEDSNRIWLYEVYVDEAAFHAHTQAPHFIKWRDATADWRESVRESAVVHTDDTGWRVGGESAFLMAFETDDATVYQVRGRHRNEEVREVVPGDYGGVMVTDRARSYDAQALSGVRQQKCLAHVLRSISEVVQTKVGRGRTPDRSRGHGFGKRLSELLREAMELRESGRRGEVADYGGETERLRREVSHHLRDRPMPDRDNWRLQNELGWHDDRGNLLRFLDDPGIEPTNNRAERALRGAVIARKVSACSKNEAGADAFSAFTSVIRTLARKGGGQSVVDGLCGVFSSAPVHARSI